MALLPHPIITLTTDYGTSDHLVGAMKGAILRVLPEATLVDINHNVAPFDILDGALTIGSVYGSFPARTVHLVVVDPGVGTERRPILVSADNGYFVGPDNGVFSLVYEREPSAQVRQITATHYFAENVSNTFHGRDIFAPVAAWLSKTLRPDALGDPIADFVRFSLPRPKLVGKAMTGVVLRVDRFGNLMTNFTPDDLPAEMITQGKIAIEIGGKRIEKFAQTFAQGANGQPFALVGSNGFLEIAVNLGNAARAIGSGRGAEVTLQLS